MDPTLIFIFPIYTVILLAPYKLLYSELNYILVLENYKSRLFLASNREKKIPPPASHQEPPPYLQVNTR